MLTRGSRPSFRDHSLYLLRIEVDGHFHGGEPVKPWVARIGGPCEKYGLQREFIRPMNDWQQAHRANSGNVYGIVATFPLREGSLYEVQRCRGNPSKRHVVREFVRIQNSKQVKLAPLDALAAAERDDGDSTPLSLPELDPEDRPYVAHVTGLGTPRKLGFVVLDGERRYRLKPGALYEVHGAARGPFAIVDDDRIKSLSHEEALSWLQNQRT